jgi:DNA-binding NtrC family response regulator
MPPSHGDLTLNRTAYRTAVRLPVPARTPLCGVFAPHCHAATVEAVALAQQKASGTKRALATANPEAASEMKGHALIVDDDDTQCDVFVMALERLGYQCTATTSPVRALELATQSAFDVVLTDLSMTEMDGLVLCQRIVDTIPDVPIVVITGQGTMDAAISAMRAGAYDFLTKPLDSKVLELSVGRAVHYRRLRSEVQRLREATSPPTVEGLFIGQSPAMKRVVDLVSRVAENEASVLIQGETGTGKELVARALHAVSGRSGPFVAINCAAVPANLLESELFGHVRGAFTDAKAPRRGLFLEATGGTLFLDEIGEMPAEMQPKLLRALQERTVRPVGSNTELECDCRIVAATHRDLEAEVEKKRFREDLFYRINVVKIDVPPLRDRGSDVLQLADFFLQRLAERGGRQRLSLSPQAAERILAYKWPGNVRELENAMERAMALARYEQVGLQDLPDKVRNFRADTFTIATDDPREVVPLEEIERRYIYRVIKLLGGNKARAAELLGLDRRTLYRRLEKYEGRSSPQEEPEPAFGTA